MKDRIIESYLKDFIEQYDLRSEAESTAFEHFINYCIVSREHPENFDFETVHVGGPGDYAIDGIAILVNDHLVSSKEDIDFFRRTLRRLDARFLFIQSKSGDKFEMGAIGNFLFGVRAFFAKGVGAPSNAALTRLRELKEYLYDCSIDFDSNPVCELYYATTGKWSDDPTLRERIDIEVNLLRQTDLFSEVRVTPLDADAIKLLYRELKRKVVREVTFDKHTILPGMADVEEAYIGILPGSEYIKLISDSDGKLQRALFYDNVRDFQGQNAVNKEIQDSLNSKHQKDKFVLLNNGITIVAQSVNKVGSTFRLKDFQIVNGCQTSHVLFRNQALLQNVFVPIKLIVTADIDVTNLITKGTNRQTEVKPEAFESLQPFQKELEEFYATFGKDKAIRLYYERRSKQYDSLPILQDQIISLPSQVKCFVGMFLNEPHSTHRYYGELLEANRSRIFLQSHSPYPYYLSGYASYVVNELFAKGTLRFPLKRFRYHLLMLFRMMCETSDMPLVSDKKKMDAYCTQLFGVLADHDRAAAVFQKGAATIQASLKVETYPTREADRLRLFTAELMSQAQAGRQPQAATVRRKRGTVVKVSVRGFGFITPDSGAANYFVHCSQVRGGYEALEWAGIVAFDIVETDKGMQAVDVEVITRVEPEGGSFR